MEEMNIEADAEQALHRIAEAAEKLLPLLSEDEQRQVRGSVELLERKVIPLLNHECPLLVAVTGGGSVGKSTLFNMLAGGKFSGVKSSMFRRLNSPDSRFTSRMRAGRLTFLNSLRPVCGWRSG